MEEWVVLVDEDDREIGYEEKLAAHVEGKLHRAFSVYIYDEKSNSLLMQQRGSKKYHSGSVWSNSCCSHPLKGETWEDAIGRCMKNELGMTLDTEDFSNMKNVGKFRYKSFYKNTGNYEHEIDYVWVLTLEQRPVQIEFNPAEVDDVDWVSVEQLDRELAENPDKFSTWFAPSYRLFRQSLADEK